MGQALAMKVCRLKLDAQYPHRRWVMGDRRFLLPVSDLHLHKHEQLYTVHKHTYEHRYPQICYINILYICTCKIKIFQMVIGI